MLHDPTAQPSIQAPAASIPPQPTYPQTRVDVQIEGIVITVVIAPTTQIVQFIPDDMLDQINKKRLDLKRQQRDTLATLHDVKRSNTPH